jgi:hypothetical protein
MEEEAFSVTLTIPVRAADIVDTSKHSQKGFVQIACRHQDGAQRGEGEGMEHKYIIKLPFHEQNS